MTGPYAIVVEPDSVNRRMASRVVERAGLVPVGADSAAAARQLLEQLGRPVDLVFVAAPVTVSDASALAWLARVGNPAAAVVLALDCPAAGAALGETASAGVILLQWPYSVRELGLAVRTALDPVTAARTLSADAFPD